MKSKLFKKAIACLCTAAMAAQFGFVIPASAEGEYYKFDFEQETARGTDNNQTGDKKADDLTLADGTKWHSFYGAGGMSIAKDATEGINMYYKYALGSTSGQRGAYYIPSDAVKTVDENQRSVLEMDFSMSTGADGSQLVLTNTMSLTGSGNSDEKSIPTNSAYNKDYVMALYQKKDGTIAINTVDGTDTTTVTTGYTAGKWAHLKGVMDFKEDTLTIKITSLDGATTYLEEIKVAMKGDNTAPGAIVVSQPRNSNAATGIDNIVFRPYVDGDVEGVYYMATINVDGNVVTRTADKSTGLISDIPDTAKTGYIFDGWSKDGDTENLLSTEQILSTSLTADVTYEAVYHKDPDYIEPMVALEFSSFPANGIPTAGPDENTAESNPITVKIVGEIGGNLTENPDARVTDLDVKWEFAGFRHIPSKAAEGNGATTDAADSNEYCDSYAEVVYDNANPTSVDFKLKSQAFNFYGEVRATVTYNGKTMTVKKPMAIVPTKAQETGVILPKPGYVTDFDWYADDMVGYQATTSADNKAATDIVTGDWAAYGGNSGRGLYLVKDAETGKKFMKLKSTGTNSSSFAVNKLDSAPTGQVIIAQDVKFYNAKSAILFKTDNPVTWKDTSTTISFDFDGSGFVINGSDKICDAAAGKWYTIVLSADVTSKLASAKVFDKETGEVLGTSEIMPFVNAGSTAPVYLCYRTPDNAQGELDFNNVKIYTPTIDDTKFTVVSADETLSIPKAGAADVTTTITASALSTEGYDMIGTAEWAFDSSVADTSNIAITPDAANTHMATLTVKAGAPAGDLPINVTIGGVTKQIKIALTSSQDSVQFTRSTASISIPLEANTSNEYEFAAKVVGPKSDEDDTPIDIEGKTVTLAMYDKNNTNELTVMPKGVTFDAASGKLTVSNEASATTFYIRATSTNRKDEPITKAIKVTVHGLAFDFGSDADDAVAEGYTAVTPTTVYSDATGYGIESGTPTVDGTGTIDNADSDSLKGAFTFKAKVTPAKVYNVTINFTGSVVSEKVSADLSGVTYTASGTYQIPVIDDVLDLTFSGGSVSSIIIEKQEDKAPNLKPNIFTVGDSTIANNGSWAYVAARDYATYAVEGDNNDLTDIATLTNNGRGGKNLSSYYTGGELRDRILTQIRPGDYVMIGDMGTNGMGADFEGSFNYYIDACEAMGAKIILNSYTPHGAVGDYANGYDAATNTFDSYRKDAYDVIVQKIYAERTLDTAPAATPIQYENGVLYINYGKEEAAVLIIAEYKADGTLDKVSVEDIALNAEGATTVEKTIPENAKVMLWKSLETAEPLLGAYTVGKNDTVSKYDENIVGFVDIGKMADAAFNAYVNNFAANGYADKDAAAQAIIKCFGDHNHYSNDILAANLMIKGYGAGDDAKGIIKTLYEIVSADLAKY